jgi:hypothetical protein
LPLPRQFVCLPSQFGDRLEEVRKIARHGLHVRLRRRAKQCKQMEKARPALPQNEVGFVKCRKALLRRAFGCRIRFFVWMQVRREGEELLL